MARSRKPKTDDVFTGHTPDVIYPLSFDSVHEFKSYAAKHGAKIMQELYKPDKTKEWVFSEEEANPLSVEQCVMLYENGIASKATLRLYEEAVNACRTTIGRMMGPVKDKRRKRAFNEFDGECDIDRLLAGNEDFFVYKRKTGAPVFLDIYANCGLSWVHGEEGFAKIAAYTTALATMLEEKGIRVRVWMCLGVDACFNSGANMALRFIGKDYGEDIDIPRMLRWATSGMLRHFGFHAENVLAKEQGETVTDGRGYSSVTFPTLTGHSVFCGTRKAEVYIAPDKPAIVLSNALSDVPALINGEIVNISGVLRYVRRCLSLSGLLAEQVEGQSEEARKEDYLMERVF